jgi:hypothetical protein
MAIADLKDFNAGADIQHLRNLHNRLRNETETTFEDWAKLMDQSLLYATFGNMSRKSYPLIQKQLDTWIEEAKAFGEIAMANMMEKAEN